MTSVGAFRSKGAKRSNSMFAKEETCLLYVIHQTKQVARKGEMDSQNHLDVAGTLGKVHPYEATM